MLNHLSNGIFYLLAAIPIAFCIVLVVISLKFILGKKADITFFNTFNELMWLIVVISILLITGIIEAIIGGTFGVTSILDGSSVVSLTLLSEGITPATLLNILLFIPYGFFSVLVFKKIKSRQIYGILIGFLFTSIIETIQLFTGRFFQLDDIIMNTLGTYIGVLLGKKLLDLKRK